jgi:hypothetical protein
MISVHLSMAERRYRGRMSQSTKPQKSALPLRSDEQQVAPAVKAWLDNVIVPALVKQLVGRTDGRSRRQFPERR